MGVIARQSIKASVIGLIGVAIGAFSKLFVFTKFLTTDEIGLLDVITKMTLLMMAFFILGSPQVIKRYFAKYATDKNDGGLIYTYSILLLTSIVISSLLYLALLPIISKSFVENAPLLIDYLHLPLFCSILFAIFLFANAIGSIQMRIVVPAFFNQIVNRVLVLLVVGAYGFNYLQDLSQFTWLYVMAFFAVPAIATVLYIVFYLKPNFIKVPWSQSKSIFNYTKQYNFYLVLSVASGYIIQAIDAQMISAKMDLSSAGIYSIVFYMGTVIQIPKKALASLSIPYLSKALKEDRIGDVQKIYSESSLNQLIVGGLIFILVWLNIDSLFSIIPNGADFKIGKLVVLYIGMGKLFDMSMGVNRQIIEASKFYKYNLGINIVLSVLVIVLNLIFIPLDNELIGGLNGAAFASMLAMVSANLLSLWLLKVKMDMHPIQKKLFIVAVLIIFFMICYPYISINFTSQWLNLIINSALIVLLFSGLNLLLGTSKEINKQVRNLYHKLF